jgi:hypothetical protein
VDVGHKEERVKDVKEVSNLYNKSMTWIQIAVDIK